MLLWMLSDLAWLQCWLYASLVVACIAGALSVFFIARHVLARKWTGAFSESAVILWLFANTFWMYGECHDIHYNTEILNPDAMLYDQAAKKTGHMLWTVGAMFLSLCIARFLRGRFGFERLSTKAKMQSNSNIPLRTITPVQSERSAGDIASKSKSVESPKAADDPMYSCLRIALFVHLIHVVRYYAASLNFFRKSSDSDLGFDETGAAPLHKAQDAVDLVWPSQSPVWPHSDHKCVMTASYANFSKVFTAATSWLSKSRRQSRMQKPLISSTGCTKFSFAFFCHVSALQTKRRQQR